MGARNRIRQLARRGAGRMLVRDFFRSTPAWLVSLVFHAVLLMLLALLVFRLETSEKTILLSASVSKNRQEGGEIVPEDADSTAFDLPVPADVDMSNPETRQAMVRANQDARELQIDPNTPDPTLPPLTSVKRKISSGRGATFAARDPRIRVDMVKREGGTTQTEAAVARGLRWMSQHQYADGRWSLNNIRGAANCDCSGKGSTNNDAAGTSLVLLPYLGAGQTHLVGRYKDTVSGGLRWLVENQDPETGNLGANWQGSGANRRARVDNASIYAHGQATIVLCEAYAMTGDDMLREPAEKAVKHILDMQHRDGGWRYHGQSLTGPSDTSVVGWQLMALQSARAANIEIAPERFELANQFLDRVARDNGSKYSYTAGAAPTPIMTAEGLLCRMYLGWGNDRPGLRLGTKWLATPENLPSESSPNMYYWYYATQTMHHYGGPNWETWNNRMRSVLIGEQETAGHAAGSWYFGGGGHHSGHSHGGRLYCTALSTCTLEVYYRHLPIFKQLDLDVEFEE